jgi:hypothetical protein
MAEYQFGSGVMYGRQTNTSPASPIRFGGLQEVTVDIAFTTKQLYGQYQFPIAVGRGTAKVSGKAKWAQFNAQAFNDVFFGLSTPATGEYKTAVAEAQTVTANAITVTHNGANVYSQDMGVVYSANGTALQRVTSAVAAGQYTCNETTGVYGFASGDNSVAMLVSYVWKDAGNGKLITMTNQLLGQSPQFITVLTNTFQSKQLTLVLNACMSSKLTFPTKLEDFWIPEFDFEAFVDASNVLGTLSLDE